MTDAEEKYKASVEKSQQEAHEETMWGKPARDIVTGIGNNGGIHPDAINISENQTHNYLIDPVDYRTMLF